MKKFAHLNLKYMFPYEYTYFKGGELDDYILFKYSSYGTETSVLFIWTIPIIRCQSSLRMHFLGLDISSQIQETCLMGQKLITAFGNGDGSTVYVMAKGNVAGSINLWTNSNSYNYINEEDFTSQSFTPTSETWQFLIRVPICVFFQV